jgi:hypothetical protein
VFDTRYGYSIVSINPILLAVVDSVVYLAHSRDENFKHARYFRAIRAWPVRKADKSTAIYEPIV